MIAYIAESMKDGIERLRVFVYLKDEVNAGGEYLRALTARLCIGWINFKEKSGILCGRKWS